MPHVRPNQFHKFLPHLADPVDAFALADLAGSTVTGTESALRAMHRRGIVRKLVQRKRGEFVANKWVRV